MSARRRAWRSLFTAGVPVVLLAATPARADEAADVGSCGALVDYLREPGTVSAHAASDFIARAAPACRAEIRGGAAPEAVAVARAWTQGPDRSWVVRGRILLCAMQDPGSLGDIATWMRDPSPDARAVCASALATWPGAESIRGPVFDRALRRHPGNWPENWEVDPAVVAAAATMGPPELRDQLAALLAAAHAHQADGYDRLHAVVCTNDEGLSAGRARVCSTLPAKAEDDWRRHRRTRDLRVVQVALPLSYAGLVTWAHVDRENAGGRNLATTGGAFAGAVIVGGLAGAVVEHSTGDRSKALAATIGGMVAGAVLGGLAAHAAPPNARAPVTAVGFAPILLPLTLSLHRSAVSAGESSRE